MAESKSKRHAEIQILRMKPRRGKHIDLTEQNAEDLFKEIRARYDRNFRKIVVDLSTVSSVDITAVNAFLTKRSMWPSMDLRFYCPKGPVYDFLVDSRFAKVFNVYIVEDEAKKSFTE